MSDVTYADVERLHRRITEHAPYRANRVVALLSKMFNLAIRWEMRTDNPTKWIERNQETKIKRYLKPDELARLMTELDKLADKQVVDIIRLLLLTGARSDSEVFSMRWDQLDLDAGKWKKPGSTTKQKTEHEVPLSAEAVQLLEELKERAEDGAKWVFPSRKSTGHRVDIYKPWVALLKAANITDRLRIHDLRHSFASFLVSAGHGLPVIGALLGHTQASTTQRYAHLHDEVQRVATGQVGAMVRGAKRSAKVVKLPTRA